MLSTKNTDTQPWPGQPQPPGSLEPSLGALQWIFIFKRGLGSEKTLCQHHESWH